MNIGHVQGGTNAGWRIVKQPKQWSHDCTGVKMTLTSYSCPLCHTRRPA
jgi:hypothetical protein